MRHVEQQSHGRKTHTYAAAIHLKTFKNCASLLQVYKTLQEIGTNVHALHFDKLDHIRLCWNSVNHLKETLCDH